MRAWAQIHFCIKRSERNSGASNCGQGLDSRPTRNVNPHQSRKYLVKHPAKENGDPTIIVRYRLSNGGFTKIESGARKPKISPKHPAKSCTRKVKIEARRISSQLNRGAKAARQETLVIGHGVGSRNYCSK
jgi:hypothetical protein